MSHRQPIREVEMAEESLIVPETQESRLLGLEKAAAYIDTTPRTVQRLIKHGLLRPVKLGGLRRVLIDRDDLDQLIEAGKSGE
jgi:excisionase family DNA binding protein